MRGTLTIGGVTLAVSEFTIRTADCPMPWVGRERYTIGPAAWSGEFTVTIQWDPGAWSTLNDLVAALECRRWLNLGGPLASWYRGRPGWRLADAVEAGRN